MNEKIIFMGSPEFAVPILKKLVDECNVIGVVTQPDRPSGRGRVLTPPPVKTIAVQYDLPLLQPERLKTDDEIALIRAWRPELIVVAAFGQILRGNLLDLPVHGCINVHASLLPRWRGAAPIQAAILHGDKETGVTIMKMDAGIDTGQILSQKALKIRSDDTSETLSARLAEAGADLLIETLPLYLAGKLEPVAQNDKLATYAKMIRKEEGLLNFNGSAAELCQKVRAFNPWPGAYTWWKGSVLKIHQARDIKDDASEPGKCAIVEGYPAIGTTDGWLILEVLQPGGKKRMTGDTFLRGAKDWVDSRLETHN